VPAYDLRVPATLEEALALIAESGGSWRPFAGGTDLMVLLEAGKLPQTRYVSLRGLDALTGVIVALRADGYDGWLSLETHWAGPGGNDKMAASTICGWNMRGLASA